MTISLPESAGTRSGAAWRSAPRMAGGDPLDGRGAAAGRRRLARIDQAALRQMERERAEAAAVVGNAALGIRHRTHGEARGGIRSGRHAVERPAHLRRGAGEIAGHPAVGDRHRDLDAHQPVQLDAVVVEVVHMAIGARPQAAQRLARHRLGAVQQFVEQRQQFVAPEVAGQLAKPSRADRAGGDLRVDVAHQHVRHAHVLPQHRDQRVVQRVAATELQQRDANAFLEDLGGVGRRGARRHAADVLVMRHRRADRDHASVGEHRHHDGDVRQMRAAEIGVVEDPDVALAHRLERHVVQQPSHHRRQRAEMHRDGERLRQCLALQREQAGRGVQAFLHDGGEGAAHQRELHLVGDAVELVAQHFERDRIDVHAQPRVSRRLPLSSTVPRQPGSTSVVVSSCSTIAGPAKVRPAGIAARW